MTAIINATLVMRDHFIPDAVLFVEDGKILAVGSHEELLASSPEYRTTVELQKLDEEKEGA